MIKEKDKSIEDIKKEIAIERLRQTPSSVKVSFGAKSQGFIGRDEMIEQVENNTNLGRKIVKVQLEYLKAFKKGLLQ